MPAVVPPTATQSPAVLAAATRGGKPTADELGRPPGPAHRRPALALPRHTINTLAAFWCLRPHHPGCTSLSANERQNTAASSPACNTPIGIQIVNFRGIPRARAKKTGRPAGCHAGCHDPWLAAQPAPHPALRTRSRESKPARPDGAGNSSLSTATDPGAVRQAAPPITHPAHGAPGEEPPPAAQPRQRPRRRPTHGGVIESPCSRPISGCPRFGAPQRLSHRPFLARRRQPRRLGLRALAARQLRRESGRGSGYLPHALGSTGCPA
jgi:hypothetical protein